MSGATVAPEPPRFPMQGRRLVLGIGVCYLALTAGFPLLPIADDEPIALWAVLGVLSVVPGSFSHTAASDSLEPIFGPNSMPRSLGGAFAVSSWGRPLWSRSRVSTEPILSV